MNTEKELTLEEWNKSYIWASIKFFGGIALMIIGWHLMM